MSAPGAAALPALRRDLHQGPCQAGVSVPCRRQARKHDSISVSRRRGTQGSAAIPRQGAEWVEGLGPARDVEHLPRCRRGEPGGLVNRAGAPGGFEETGPFLGGEIFMPALVDQHHGRMSGMGAGMRHHSGLASGSGRLRRGGLSHWSVIRRDDRRPFRFQDQCRKRRRGAGQPAEETGRP